MFKVLQRIRSQSIKTLVVLAGLANLTLPAQTPSQTHPNLSGSWVRVSQSCHPHEKTNNSLQMIVDHREPILSVTIRTRVKGTIRELALIYRTGGEELHYTGLDGDDFHSKLHWQENDLIFDIVELERGSEIHAQEAWSLQSHGSRLIRTKTENGPVEHSTCQSIFKKSRL